MPGSRLDPTAFDAFAADYDQSFTRSTLTRLLRPRVWQTLAKHFNAGQHLLELACGTGEDALWLAQRGIHVTATDGSAAMVELARAKLAEATNQAGEEAQDWAEVKVIQRSLQHLQPSSFSPHPFFDGAFSNFGGINTVNAWPVLAERLSRLIKPSGKVILIPMGPLCFWEMGWYALHGQFGRAFRRFGRQASASIGPVTIPVWYPSPRQLKQAFRPWFDHLETSSLGLWLPPSYLGHFVDRRPTLFARLNRFEQATAHLTAGWGDHYIIIFSRK